MIVRPALSFSSPPQLHRAAACPGAPEQQETRDLVTLSGAHLDAQPGVQAKSRHVEARGDARERGRQIGEATREGIRALFERKQEIYADRLEEWKAMARESEPYIERHAPTAYAEMQGMGSVDGLDMETLLMLACEYEMHMGHPDEDGKCTGFASLSGPPGEEWLIAGQTNDETFTEWLDGEHDVVLHTTDEAGKQTLIYTHAGNPAYMGMNSDGLVLLWQYIDNGERSPGVPTNVLIREALTRATLESAVEYLQTSPRTVPNNYIVAQEEHGIVNVESTPTRFSRTSRDHGSLTHANHVVFDAEMAADDIGVLRPTTTTRARYETVHSLLPPERDDVDAEVGKEVLSTPPIDCPRTLATMVFEPAKGQMHIKFARDGEFQTHRFVA